MSDVTDDDLLTLLRDDVARIDEALEAPRPPLTAVLVGGRGVRRRRGAVRVGGAGLLVAAGVLLVAVLGRPPWAATLPAPLPGGTTTRATATPALTTVRPDAAARQVGALLRVEGTPYQAWAMDDADGPMLVLVTRTLEPGSGLPVPLNGVLRIYRSTGASAALVMEQDNTREARSGHLVSRGKQACSLHGGIDVTEHSSGLIALPEGRGGVTVGWWRQCRADRGPARVSLGLVTRRATYLMSGSGVLRRPTPGIVRGQLMPASTGLPAIGGAPPPGLWPDGTADSALKVFLDLYR